MNYSLPQECKMPDLSDIELSAVNTYLLSSLVGENKGVSEDFELYRRSLVRLIDKAIIEYNEVRNVIEQQIADKDGTIYIASIINHLENCINSTKRSFNFLDKIRRHKDAVPLDKIIVRYLRAHQNTLRHIRDAVEHADDDIQNGKITKGKTIALSVSQDASEIVVFEYSFSTNDLAVVLRNLHQLALKIAKYGINNETPQT